MPLIRRGQAKPAAETRDDPDALSLLVGGTDDQRWSAARAAPGSPEAIQALGRALLAETSPRVREAILTSLVRAAALESVDAILPLLRSDDASLRTAALDALRTLAGTAAPRLPALLSDRDADVRLLACEALRGLSSAEATPLLCDLLMREDQVNVCAAAVEVLSEIGGSDALQALSACAARFPQEPFLLFSIKAASARIGDQSHGRRG